MLFFVEMKRQPFHPTFEGCPTQMGSELIEQLPDVASWVGRIAVNWSGVELQLALTLGSMLGVESEAAVAVFLSLRNHRAQRDSINAAVLKALSDRDQKICNALLEVHKELDGQRNDVIHGIWGCSASTPDGIIWSSSQDHANMLINAYHREQDRPSYDEVTSRMTRDYWVVRYGALEELNNSIKDLGRTIGNFHAYLRYRNEPAGRSAYQAVMSDPEIKKRI